MLFRILPQFMRGSTDLGVSLNDLDLVCIVGLLKCRIDLWKLELIDVELFVVLFTLVLFDLKGLVLIFEVVLAFSVARNSGRHSTPLGTFGLFFSFNFGVDKVFFFIGRTPNMKILTSPRFH